MSWCSLPSDINLHIELTVMLTISAQAGQQEVTGRWSGGIDLYPPVQQLIVRGEDVGQAGRDVGQGDEEVGCRACTMDC